MSGAANPARGDASLRVAGEEITLRPSFTALVSAEEELGSLFDLIERAAAGKLGIGEIAALFDHLSKLRSAGISRTQIGEALVELGMAKVTPMLRTIFAQILQGR